MIMVFKSLHTNWGISKYKAELYQVDFVVQVAGKHSRMGFIKLESCEIRNSGQNPRQISSVDEPIVSGEKKMESKKEEKDWHVMERRFGSFYRSVQLPFEPATEAIAAHYAKGVLHLTVQKPAAKVKTAKTIPVMTGLPKETDPSKSH